MCEGGGGEGRINAIILIIPAWGDIILIKISPHYVFLKALKVEEWYHYSKPPTQISNLISSLNGLP